MKELQRLEKKLDKWMLKTVVVGDVSVDVSEVSYVLSCSSMIHLHELSQY